MKYIYKYSDIEVFTCLWCFKALRLFWNYIYIYIYKKYVSISHLQNDRVIQLNFKANVYETH